MRRTARKCTAVLLGSHRDRRAADDSGNLGVRRGRPRPAGHERLRPVAGRDHGGGGRERPPLRDKSQATVAVDHAVALTYVKTMTAAYKAEVAAAQGQERRQDRHDQDGLRREPSADTAPPRPSGRSQERRTRSIAAVTTATGKHYTPVDGVCDRNALTILHPQRSASSRLQVRITVYGGHVSDIAVTQYASTGDPAPYNDMALPTPMTEAMNSTTPRRSPPSRVHP